MKTAGKLYIIGLIIHLLYNVVIISTDNVISHCWHVDNGNLTEIINMHNSDSRSYIESADGYIKEGVFSYKNMPDYHRTIGYPLIIAIFKMISWKYWYILLTIFQTFVGTLIYPLSFLIGKIFLPKDDKKIFYSIITMMLLGGYFTKSLYVLSDMTFSVFFLSGVYFSLLSTTKRNDILIIILGFILITFAALIRPVLILYPIVHFLILLYISKYYKTWNYQKTKLKVILSALLLILSVNISSVRIYHYYKNISPTDILGINMFDYTVKNVMIKENQLPKYIKLEKDINKERNWLIKDKKRKNIFFNTFKEYPVTTIMFWIKRGAFVHLFYPHYMQIGEIYGYFNKEKTGRNKPMTKSVFMQIVLYLFAVVNFIIFLFFALYLFEQLVYYKQILFFITILFMVFFVLGPSFLAPTSPRMRLPVEPFIFIFAFKYLFQNFSLKFIVLN